MVEQIVCSQGRVFVGTCLSTFSGYIHRVLKQMYQWKYAILLVLAAWLYGYKHRNKSWLLHDFRGNFIFS